MLLAIILVPKRVDGQQSDVYFPSPVLSVVGGSWTVVYGVPIELDIEEGSLVRPAICGSGCWSLQAD